MTIKETWEKFQYLDYLLSDREWIGSNLKDQILYDLWQAIKSNKDDEELAQLRKIANAAEAFVKDPEFQGICDEDIHLEAALKEGGYLK
jgi:hypothetical protein